MPKKKMSDIVFQRVSPPDYKQDLTIDDLSVVLVRRIGLKRKESKANHSFLLRELIKFKKDGVPITIEKISEILGVSQSQTYEEIRKWRTLGLLEFVRQQTDAGDVIKGYMLSGTTTNRLMDRVESSFKSFMRNTRRIAKDFDDLLMLEIARSQKNAGEPIKPPQEPPEPEEPEPPEEIKEDEEYEEDDKK